MTSTADLPQPGEGKRGEAGYLGYLLRQAAHAYRQAQERALADLALTPPQFSVLTMVKAYPGASGAELARLALLTPQTMNVIVKNLLRAGLLARSHSQTHGRILHLALTKAGQEMLDLAKTRIQILEMQLANGLDDRKLADLRHWLAKTARPQD